MADHPEEDTPVVVAGSPPAADAGVGSSAAADAGSGGAATAVDGSSGASSVWPPLCGPVGGCASAIESDLSLRTAAGGSSTPQASHAGHQPTPDEDERRQTNTTTPTTTTDGQHADTDQASQSKRRSGDSKDEATLHPARLPADESARASSPVRAAPPTPTPGRIGLVDLNGAYHQSVTTLDAVHEGTSFEELRLAEEAIGAPAYTGPRIWTLPFSLHRDAMQSVFAFLDQLDFAHLARTSRDFLHVASRMSSRRWQVECHHSDRLACMLASPLRRHIGSLDSFVSFSHDLLPVRLVLPPATLTTIVERLTRLEVLKCEVALQDDMPPPKCPTNLRRLHLQLHVASDLNQPQREVDRLLTRMGEWLVTHAPLVDDFSCTVKYGPHLRDSRLTGELFAPLLQWTHLRRLTLHGWRIAPEVFTHVRRMDHLTYLESNQCRQFLDLLSTDDGPMPCRLEEIRPGQSDWLVVSPRTLPVLLQLTSLRVLHAVVFVDLADPAPLLPTLCRLRSLEVTRGSCQLATFLATLQQCTELIELQLGDDEDVTEVHLAALLAPMRHLRRLTVPSSGIHSLAFLGQSAHLGETLQEFALSGCCRLDPTEVLAHLRPLRALVTLQLWNSLPADLDSAIIDALTPGTDGFERATWPHLRTFEWSPWG